MEREAGRKGQAWARLSQSTPEAGPPMMRQIQQPIGEPHPSANQVMSAALDLLDFQTQAARDIEAGRIKSVLHPILADHSRRETLKFIDEFKRTMQ